ncbi:protoporphyrinogen oxidase [Streptomyces albus]|uniref:protoporphyrinogen oxidase n=1 Tax=Streptomyces albus TaxID=1888 RepID=UPI0004C62892|nr:protoporphyrinogen oxidase [Streptomyces albus]
MSETHASAGHVVVVGGGVSGLAAAHRLLAGGARVTVLEASPRVGGKLLAGELAGVPVDFGAESMLARRPEAVDLARSVGLSGRLQPPTTASATLWTRGALRPMPKGHVMGVPGDVEALAASGVISEEGLARIAREPELPPDGIGEGEDVAVGGYLADRLGREVVDRLVEPLLGGVYAGDSYRISLRAAVPQLYRLAREGRSLTEGVREMQRRAAGQPDPGPVFMGLDGGVGTLPPAVAEACRAAGAEVATGASVTELRRTGEGWRLAVEGPGAEPAAAAAAGRPGAAAAAGSGVSGPGRRVIEADAVVLAVPAPVAARLLTAEAPAAAAELAAVEYASMALVSMVFRRAELTPVPEGSGFLVPPVDGHTIKAATFASRKWGWIDAAAPDLFVIRTSVGRFGEEAELKRDDAGLVEVSLRDLGEAVGLRARPVATRVTRWTDGLPQYPVGHPDRVARVRERLAGLPTLRLCGAAYDGVGIPACIASAAGAAGAVLDTLTRRAAEGGGE